MNALPSRWACIIATAGIVRARAAAFSAVLVVPAAGFKLLRGSPRFYSVPRSSSRSLSLSFSG
jgi:hypothetical protein